MSPVLLASFGQYVLGITMALVAIFLILLILIQRGRGGGLTGAFGGVGGQSAFGTKAGDVFTRVTVVTAVIWLLLCLLAIATLNGTSGFRDRGNARGGDKSASKDSGALEGAPAGKESTAKESELPKGPAGDTAQPASGQSSQGNGAGATSNAGDSDATGARSESSGDGAASSGRPPAGDANPAPAAGGDKDATPK